MKLVKNAFPSPALKPKEAIFGRELDHGQEMDLIATHPVTLAMLGKWLKILALEKGRDIYIKINTRLAKGA